MIYKVYKRKTLQKNNINYYMSADLNVNNYTISELLEILELDVDDPTRNDIIDKTNELIDRFTDEGNEGMASF